MVVPIFESGDYDAQVSRAAELLSSGGVVLLPTETIYGAAAILNQPQGLARIRALPPALLGKPLTIHLGRRDDADKFLGQIPELGQRMIRKLWPGPVSLTFDVDPAWQAEVAQSFGVEPREIYHNNTTTLRFPDQIVAIDVIGKANGPVVMRRAGGLANRAETAVEEWGDQLDLALDAGPTRYSKPSTMVRVKRDNTYEILRAGVYDQRIIERLLRTTVLYVCSGNTCRSPMAEGITRKLLADRLGIAETDLEKKGLNVVSAGSFAMPGAKAAPPAVEALRPIGVDLSRHRSRPLTVELIHQADVIYTMGRSHAAAVKALVPTAADKVVTLNPAGEIDDPIGGDVELYKELAGQLHELIERRLAERPLP